MGDFLGAYTVGSGAQWDDGTDYTDPVQLENMRRIITDYVKDHRNEPYVLMWILGNENNYGYGNNAQKKPQAFYRFANEMARFIHHLDPYHPVALSNGDLEFLDIIGAECPDVDVLALNVYRGASGMGESFWQNLDEIWKKPVLIAEFGCPAFNPNKDFEESEKDQAQYLVSSWADIEAHAAGARVGNSIGGVVFEWIDEWWKAGPEYDVRTQDMEPQGRGPFPGGYMYEEWLGLVSQGDGDNSPYLRQPRLAYKIFQKGPWRSSLSFPSTASTAFELTSERSHEN
jgi:beta-glucuronidase